MWYVAEISISSPAHVHDSSNRIGNKQAMQLSPMAEYRELDGRTHNFFSDIARIKRSAMAKTTPEQRYLSQDHRSMLHLVNVCDAP
jgi:hypothetical protein